jgi:DNA-binding transcriptional LysR family regulator
MPGTPSIDLLEIFLAVAQANSFSLAATRLQMPKSSVSRGMARLEAQLGVELFHRTTHHVALSPGGEALLPRVAGPLASLKGALTGLPGQSHEPSGKLRIAAPEDFAIAVLAGATASFTQTFPRVQVETVLDNRPVDLVRDGFDLAVRAHRKPLKDSSMQVRRLGAIEFGFYASARYVERNGEPKKLSDPKHQWVATRNRPFDLEPNPEAPRLVSDDFLFIRELLRAHAGVGLLPGFVAACDVTSGKLVRVLERTPIKPAGLALLFPRSLRMGTNVLAFRDHLVGYLKDNPLSP